MVDVADTFLQAQRLHQSGQLAEALSLYRQVVESDPRHAEAWHRVGCLVSLWGQKHEALECFTRAIKLRGDVPAYHNNLGECLRKLGQFDDALASYEQALRLQDDYLVARVNLVMTLHAVGRTDEARRLSDDAARRQPASAEAACVWATMLFARGEFARGWEAFEWRLALGGGPPPSSDPTRWQGEPLAGRSILIRSEGGLGDIVQFIRYLPWVSRQAGRMVLAAPRCLMPLLTAANLAEVVPDDVPPPATDLHVALFSLPWVLRDTLQQIPASVPYLSVPAPAVAEWKQRLAGIDGFRVGINWQGSSTTNFDQTRSFPLTEMAPLADVPGVKLISLQKKEGVEQLAALGGRFAVHDLGPEFYACQAAFVDTAPAMRNLDLVITSDTAMVHLAGALGVPVWVVLSTMPDWRWMYERVDCLWYPTMRLFRQQHLGDWSEVFARVAAELAREAQRKGRL